GLTAEAILHFNTAALEEIELPGKQNLVGSEKNKPGIFLELALQANFPPGSSDTEQELFDGLMILMAHE
ncbi:MAG: hypothetical protein GY943_11065, partial [Chloroflexi bacterium]|nr:hypothetical protein [Chloroflexota bacterium]